MLRLSLLVTAGLLVGTAPLPAIAQPAGRAPITITATELVVRQTAQEATFTGNVTVTQADLTLTAETLTASYGGGALTRMVAAGGVTITRRGGALTETASGQRAVYTPAENTLILTGPTVSLRRGASTLTGDRLVYNLATEEARVTNQGGPVQATFTPAGN